MIEKVARALCRYTWERNFDGEKLDAFVDAYWKDHLPGARIAIETMSSPTAAMIAAGTDANPYGRDAALGWSAMIDAALTP